MQKGASCLVLMYMKMRTAVEQCENMSHPCAMTILNCAIHSYTYPCMVIEVNYWLRRSAITEYVSYNIMVKKTVSGILSYSHLDLIVYHTSLLREITISLML